MTACPGPRRGAECEALRSSRRQETRVTSTSLRPPAPTSTAPGVSVRREDGIVVVALTGSLDIYSLPALRDELEVLAGTEPMVVDLSEVSLIDSAGLGALLRLSNRCAREGTTRFGLICPRRRLRRVFEITGLRPAFTMGADLAAVRALWEARP